MRVLVFSDVDGLRNVGPSEDRVRKPIEEGHVKG